MFKLTNLLAQKAINLIKDFTKNPDAIQYLDFVTYKSSSGVYGFSNLGLEILKLIKDIIKRSQNKFGYEINLSCIANSNIYKQSGRTNKFQMEMFNLSDKLCLQPTCEESAIISLIYNGISYKNFPVYFYQISKKFRNELRPRNNIIRCLEFEMKDGYSFHTSKECADEFYNLIKKSYLSIFNELGINVKILNSDTESMIAESSEEFIYQSQSVVETKKHNLYGIEIGHIFQLGNSYSKNLNIMYTNQNNNLETVFMNSYGIGLYRLLYIFIEKLINMEIKNSLLLFDICLIGKKSVNEYMKTKFNNLKIIEFNIESLDLYHKIQFAKYLPVKKIILFHKSMIFVLVRCKQNFISYIFEESYNLSNIINLKLNL